MLALMLFLDEAKQGLQNSFFCQKQGTEDVIVFAAGTQKSMANLPVMRRTEAHAHISLCFQRIPMCRLECVMY